MLTTRENALAISRHEQPDYYGDFMMAVKAIDDPIRASDAIPMDGKPHLDSWGVTKVWPVGTYAPLRPWSSMISRNGRSVSKFLLWMGSIGMTASNQQRK